MAREEYERHEASEEDKSWSAHGIDIDALIADITYLNFNVTYEIGFAIGQNKRTILIRNVSIEGHANRYSEIGIFDTIGYFDYNNSDELYTYNTEGVSDFTPIRTDYNVNTAAPISVQPTARIGRIVHLWPNLDIGR